MGEAEPERRASDQTREQISLATEVMAERKLRSGRLGDCSSEAPTDPDVRISRIRLFGPRLRYVTGEGRMRGGGSG